MAMVGENTNINKLALFLILLCCSCTSFVKNVFLQEDTPVPELKVRIKEKLPIRLGVMFSDQFIAKKYKGEDVHYKDRRSDFTLNIGESSTKLFKETSPQIFEQVEYIDNNVRSGDIYLVLVPEILEVNTLQEPKAVAERIKLEVKGLAPFNPGYYWIASAITYGVTLRSLAKTTCIYQNNITL